MLFTLINADNSSVKLMLVTSTSYGSLVSLVKNLWSSKRNVYIIITPPCSF